MGTDMRGLEGAFAQVEQKADAKQEAESKEDEQVLKPMRELDEIHRIFDALGVAEGFAADRVLKWFEHKVVSNRANGHPEGCQCQLCGESRIVRRVFQKLRPERDVPYSGSGAS